MDCGGLVYRVLVKAVGSDFLFPQHTLSGGGYQRWRPRKDNGGAIRQVCTRFVALCRELGLLSGTSVAIDGSKFKAVNNRDRNFTRAKLERRRAQIEESVARYLQQLDTADRHEPSDVLAAKATRLKEKIARLKDEMRRLGGLEARMLAAPDQQI